MGILTVRTCGSLSLVPAPEILFLLLGCHVHPTLKQSSPPTLLYFVILRFYLSLIRNRKGINLKEREGGKELGRVEGGESIIRAYCMRKKIFPIKEKK